MNPLPSHKFLHREEDTDIIKADENGNWIVVREEKEEKGNLDRYRQHGEGD